MGGKMNLPFKFTQLLRASGCLGLAASLLLVTGCGSVNAHPYFPSPIKVYPGVIFDGGEAFSGGNPVWIIDMPFSFALDTLLLPFDLWPEFASQEPLKGWTFVPFPPSRTLKAGSSTNQLDQTVVDDYTAFIKEKKLYVDLVYDIRGFYEDGAGRRAVQFEAFPPDQNASFLYVLIYDKNNKRVRAIRCNRKAYHS